MAEAIHQYNPKYSLAELAKPEYVKVALAPLDVEVFPTDGIGLLQLKLFEATTEDKLVQPTFIVAHPTDVSPLARANDANPAVTDRFELFITGREIANGFSELNDPEDQAARFRGQVEAREAGDEEAMYYDADYIRAMEYGLAADGGRGHRHRPAGDAADRRAVDPRRDPVSAVEARELSNPVERWLGIMATDFRSDTVTRPSAGDARGDGRGRSRRRCPRRRSDASSRSKPRWPSCWASRRRCSCRRGRNRTWSA